MELKVYLGRTQHCHPPEAGLIRWASSSRSNTVADDRCWPAGASAAVKAIELGSGEGVAIQANVANMYLRIDPGMLKDHHKIAAISSMAPKDLRYAGVHPKKF